MGAIKSILEVALDKSMGDGLEPYLPLLDRAEKRLDGLVELIGNLLSLSKIEIEGKKKVAFEPVDAPAVVKEVIDLYREKVAGQEPAGGRPCGAGDAADQRSREDLRTLLVNLIGNAIKYNRDGGTVGVHASRLDGKMRLDVADTGLGIQAQNLPHIFDDSSGKKRKRPGTSKGTAWGWPLSNGSWTAPRGRLKFKAMKEWGPPSPFISPSIKPLIPSQPKGLVSGGSSKARP